MAKGRRSAVAVFLVGVGLLVGGTYVGVISATRDFEDGYNVRILAAAGLDWTVWIPRTSLPMSLDVFGSIRSLAPIDTPFGAMENVTGTGAVDLMWSSHRTLDALTPMETDSRGSWNLSTWDGDNYHAWRSSTDPNASVELWLVAFRIRSQFGAFGEAGAGTQLEIVEGWNLVPALLGTGHGGTDGIPWLTFVFPSLVLVGTGLVSVPVFARFRRRTGAWNPGSGPPPR